MACTHYLSNHENRCHFSAFRGNRNVRWVRSSTETSRWWSFRMDFWPSRTIPFFGSFVGVRVPQWHVDECCGEAYGACAQTSARMSSNFWIIFAQLTRFFSCQSLHTSFEWWIRATTFTRMDALWLAITSTNTYWNIGNALKQCISWYDFKAWFAYVSITFIWLVNRHFRVMWPLAHLYLDFVISKIKCVFWHSGHNLGTHILGFATTEYKKKTGKPNKHFTGLDPACIRKQRFLCYLAFLHRTLM